MAEPCGFKLLKAGVLVSSRGTRRSFQIAEMTKSNPVQTCQCVPGHGKFLSTYGTGQECVSMAMVPAVSAVEMIGINRRES